MLASDTKDPFRRYDLTKTRAAHPSYETTLTPQGRILDVKTYPRLINCGGPRRLPNYREITVKITAKTNYWRFRWQAALGQFESSSTISLTFHT